MRSGLFLRTLTAVCYLSLGVIFVACDDTSPTSPSTTAEATSTAIRRGGFVSPVDVQVKLSAEHYTPGQTVQFDLTYTDVLDRPITIHSFPPSTSILKPETLQRLRSLPGGTDTVVLKKGEHITRSWEWDQRDDTGAQVANGRYLVGIHELLVDEGTIGWGPPPNQFIVIGDPAGNLVRTVEPGTRVDVGGAAIILDRIEFTAAQTNIYARAIPPGYDFPGARDEGAAMPPMSVMPFQPAATYSVDGSPPRSAGGGGFNPRRHDLTLIWTFDPVSATARTLTFTVTTIGKWDGPWQFTIPLQ